MSLTDKHQSVILLPEEIDGQTRAYPLEALSAQDLLEISRRVRAYALARLEGAPAVRIVASEGRFRPDPDTQVTGMVYVAPPQAREWRALRDAPGVQILSRQARALGEEYGRHAGWVHTEALVPAGTRLLLVATLQEHGTLEGGAGGFLADPDAPQVYAFGRGYGSFVGEVHGPLRRLEAGELAADAPPLPLQNPALLERGLTVRYAGAKLPPELAQVFLHVADLRQVAEEYLHDLAERDPSLAALARIRFEPDA